MTENTKNINLKKLEEIMESSFARRASINKSFEQSLRERLISQYQSNLISQNNMDGKETAKPTKKGLFGKLFSSPVKVALAGSSLLAVVGLAGVGVWYLLGYAPQSREDVFGTLSVAEGKAYIQREDEKITLKKGEEEDLEEGDTIETEEDTIADAETDYGRVSLSSKTEVTLEGEDGEVKVEKGEVYARAVKNKKVSMATPDGEVEVEGGSVLTNSSDEEGTNVKSIAGNVTGSTQKDDTTTSKEVGNGKEVDIKDNEISDEVEIDRESLKTPFCEHNFDKDDDEGFDKGTGEDLTPPEITVTSPEGGLVTKSSKLEVKAKSNEDGWAYYGGKWNEILANEEFKYEITLKSGKNDVTVKVKDKSYNKTTKTINVTYDVAGSIVLNTVSAQSNGIYLKWTAKEVNSKYSYLVRRSTNSTNSTSKNDMIKLQATSSVKEWVDTSTVKGTKYFYHVILLGPDSKEVSRTETKSAVAINEAPVAEDRCITLWLVSKTNAALVGEKALASSLSIHSSGKINVKWSVVDSKCGDYSGFKLVWNKTGSPTYPGDSAQYISKDLRTGTITESSGTWYIRVGTYNGGVTNYSNQIAVSI